MFDSLKGRKYRSLKGRSLSLGGLPLKGRPMVHGVQVSLVDGGQ